MLRHHPAVRYGAHVAADGKRSTRRPKRGLEGMIAKLRSSRYEPGRRSPAWLKVKVRREQEVVVVGWTPGEGKASDLGALVVGVYDEGRLRFAGKVGSGFDGRSAAGCPRVAAAARGRRGTVRSAAAAGQRGRWGGDLAGRDWVRPETVIRAELGGWSRDGLVRQAAFKGLEPGRDPREVVRERPIDPAAAERAAERAAMDEAEEVQPMAIGASRGGARGSAGKAARGSAGKAARGSAGKAARGSAGKATGAAGEAPRSAAAAGGPGGGVPATAFAPATEAELEALGRLGAAGTWEVGGQALALTNLDKILFPAKDGSDEPPVTKRELIGYFARIAPAMLPHLVDRPLNLHRYPNGAGRPGFWQKDIPSSAPAWLTIWHETGFREREDREANDHLVADRTATLCWLANQAAFEIHAWTATLHAPWMPTFALIDVDPGPRTTWDETLVLSRLYRTALEHLGIRAYPKTTGSRGIQAWIPVVRGKYTYADTSAWIEKLSRAIGATVPDLVSWEWSKSERGGKARLDYTQNAPIKTLVAPYAVRPRPGAPVSMPIRWEELDDPDLRPDRWTIRDAVERVTEVGDLYAGIQEVEQELPPL